MKKPSDRLKSNTVLGSELMSTRCPFSKTKVTTTGLEVGIPATVDGSPGTVICGLMPVISSTVGGDRLTFVIS